MAVPARVWNHSFPCQVSFVTADQSSINCGCVFKLISPSPTLSVLWADSDSYCHLIYTLSFHSGFSSSSLQVPGRKAGGADRHHLQPFDPDGCQHWRCHQDLALQQHETVERQLGDQNGREPTKYDNLNVMGFPYSQPVVTQSFGSSCCF